MESKIDYLALLKFDSWGEQEKYSRKNKLLIVISTMNDLSRAMCITFD